ELCLANTPARAKRRLFRPHSQRQKYSFFVVDEKVKTLNYRVNAGTWPCATHMNERFLEERCNGDAYKSFSADLFLDQHSSPLPTRMSPVHASRVTTTRLVHRRLCLLG